jgi:hypothetical protein
MVVKKNAQMKRDFQLTMSQTQLKRDRERTGRKGEQKKERKTKQSSRSNDNTWERKKYRKITLARNNEKISVSFFVVSKLISVSS